MCFSDHVNNVHTAGEAIKQVNIKKELNEDDAVASTSRDHQMENNIEDSINIKAEPVASEDQNCSLNLVRVMLVNGIKVSNIAAGALHKIAK